MSVGSVGQRIKELRKINRYTQEELAEMLGITAKHLGRIEAGNANFSIDVLMAMSQSFSISSDYILFGKEATGCKAEKLITIVEHMDAKKMIAVRDVLEYISEICDSMDFEQKKSS